MSEYRPRFVVYLRSLALGLVVAGAAGPLYAGVPTAKTAAMVPVTADTAAPAKRQGVVSAGGLNWLCQGSRCTASAAPTLLSIGSCQAVAREVGQIRSFASPPRALSAAELSQCNLGIGTGAAVGISKLTAPLAGLPPVSNPSPSGGGAPAETLSPARTQVPKTLGAAPRMHTPVPGATPQGEIPRLSTGIKKDTPRSSGPPYSFTAPAFTITGTGSLGAQAAFAPKTFTTPEFTITGTGSLGERVVFPPKSFTAPGFTVTGTGSLH